MDRKEFFLGTLVELVKRRDEYPGNHRVGALIVHKNKSIAIGYNQHKTHPLQKKYASNPESVFLHAEIDVLSRAMRVLTMKQLSKSTMYIARVKKDGSRGFAKPCKGCATAIDSFKLKKVVYT